MAIGGTAIDSTEPVLEWHDFSELSALLLYELLRFRQAIFVVEQRSVYTDLDGLDDRSHHLRLHRGEALIGYLRLTPFSDNRIAIGRVAVAAHARRQGLGRRLMRASLDRCGRDYPDHGITLSAQSYLLAFYENLGFRSTSSPYDDGGVPHIDMIMAQHKL